MYRVTPPRGVTTKERESDRREWHSTGRDRDSWVLGKTWRVSPATSWHRVDGHVYFRFRCARKTRVFQSAFYDENRRFYVNQW